MPSYENFRSPAAARRAFSLSACALLVAGLAFGLAGCHQPTAKAAAPIVTAPVPTPTRPTPTETTTAPPPDPIPNPATQPPTLIIPPAKIEPPKSRPAPADTSSTTPKPEAPQLSPQLSAAEQAEAERLTKKDIDTAEGNLQVAYGKRLNAAQTDLSEKIRGFLGQAREAIRASDWVRAKNLAQKARVLSVELINSL